MWGLRGEIEGGRGRERGRGRGEIGGEVEGEGGRGEEEIER